jgi:hypothetical protein
MRGIVKQNRRARLPRLSLGRQYLLNTDLVNLVLPGTGRRDAPRRVRTSRTPSHRHGLPSPSQQPSEGASRARVPRTASRDRSSSSARPTQRRTPRLSARAAGPAALSPRSGRDSPLRPTPISIAFHPLTWMTRRGACDVTAIAAPPWSGRSGSPPRAASTPCGPRSAEPACRETMPARWRAAASACRRLSAFL